MPATESILTRSLIPKNLLDKIEMEPNSGCWLWMGKLRPDGYAVSNDKRVHRILWELIHPPVEELHHRCNTRCCVNPDHLEPKAKQEHGKLSFDTGGNQNTGKTHCPQGHPYEGENLIILMVKGKPWRYCRICVRAAQKAYKARHH